MGRGFPVGVALKAALRSFVSKSFFPSLAFHVFSRIEGDYPRRSRYVSPGVLQTCSLVDSPDPRSLKSPIPQRGWVLISISDSVRGITSSITEFQQHLPLLRLPTDSGRRGKPFRYRFLLLRSSSLPSKDRIRLAREEVMGYAGRITCWMVRQRLRFSFACAADLFLSDRTAQSGRLAMGYQLWSFYGE